MVLRTTDKISRDAGLGVEAALPRLVDNKLNGANETDTARITDQRMRCIAANCRLHSRADAAHFRDDVALFVNLQRLQRYRRWHRMRRIRVAMAEDAELVALRQENVVE